MDPQKIIFFNIGWMSRYQGFKKQADKIVGGGAYVREHGTGHEVCNFLPTDSGKVFGHVETIKGQLDRKIQKIDNLGGKKQDFVDDVTIIWTATHPVDGRGHIVGWYKHARIYRERQKFEKLPSIQHKIDSVKSYVAETAAENAYCIPIHRRTLKLTKGVHPGQVPWRTFTSPPSAEQSKSFNRIVAFMSALISEPQETETNVSGGKNSGSASSTSYTRYMASYEARIAPSHHKLQSRFCDYLKQKKCSLIREDVDSVDVRYSDDELGKVFAEIKPCSSKDIRYAIRTAMGQLLDYQQRSKNKNKLLVVTEIEPNREDKNLALKNGFGIAFPKGRSFQVIWS